jgi:hypothetical protein
MEISAPTTLIFTLIYVETLPCCASDTTSRTMEPLLRNCVGETSFVSLQQRRNFANSNFVLIKLFILLIGHARNAKLRSRLDR